MSDSHALFVRLPAPAAEQLERIAYTSGASKREVVTRLILGDELTVGQHDFHRAPEPAALTPAQAAELLQVDEPLVLELAEAGELPGRRLGSHWRFSRAALLEWLASGEGRTQARRRTPTKTQAQAD
jgi:excisionase family DNA binding protein